MKRIKIALVARPVDRPSRKCLASWQAIAACCDCKGLFICKSKQHFESKLSTRNFDSFFQAETSYLYFWVKTSESKYPSRNIRVETSESKLPSRNYQVKTTKSKLPSQNFRVKSTESKLPSRNFRVETSESKLPSRNFRLETSDLKLPTRNFRLETSESKLPTRNFRLESSDSKVPTSQNFDSFFPSQNSESKFWLKVKTFDSSQ